MKRDPLKQSELEEAIKLVSRKEGATTTELQAVMNRASFDCPTILRYYLAKQGKTLVSEKINKSNARRYYMRVKESYKPSLKEINESDSHH